MNNKRIAIRDHTAEANLFARRSIIALLVIGVMLAVILTNLYYLQVTRFEDYQTRSNGNRIKVLPVAPNRGLIYDRNGILLAENRPIFSLEIIPEQVTNLQETLASLGELMNIQADEVIEFEQEIKGRRRFKPVALRKRLSAEDVAIFAANQHKYPGVSVEARLGRYYPYSETLTHVLGYVAKINKKDLQKLSEAGQDANYAATYDIGKLGIEKYHEEKLHGQVGYQEVEVNSQGRVIRTLNFEPPIPGQDLVLNIDVKLQQTAQQALIDKKGSVVVIDPKTGGVMALYSNPSYDPNLFVNGISSKNYNKLLSSDRPLINRASQGQYPPASTVKPFLAIVGLEEDVITTNTRVFDNGKFQLKNVQHVWRDSLSWGHGWVDVAKAIEVSCDVFFYDLAYRVGIDRISEDMGEFGFGDFTGIDLYEESNGNMPSRGWKRARDNQPWYIGDTISVGIGQGYWSVTPLQLAQALSTLVKKGKRNVPQILRGQYVKGQTILEPIKELRPIEVKNIANWNVALDGMYNVVNGDEGTARRAFQKTQYVSAGKSGTAQLISIAQDAKYDKESIAEKHRDNAMYIAYAPADEPELVIAVAIENAGWGGAEAAPVARQLMDYYFKDRVPDKDTVAKK
jgi:penicillin-binding protein 2